MSKTTQTTRDDGPILGIDLGTTNSLVAVCDERGPQVLTGPHGERMLPSVVRLSEADGSVEAIGSEARRSAVRFPQRTVFSIKRLMGRGVADAAGERAYLPYELVEGEHATARVKVGSTVRSPQEISAMILQELRRWAEAALGQPVRRAVVTVPAYFDDAQRQATRDAGRIAGLEVVRIVNEPTAAALAYNVGHAVRRRAASTSGKAAGKPSGVGDLRIGTGQCDSGGEGGEGAEGGTAGEASGGETVAVYDLGGGTFDISILRVEQTEQGTVDQVLATAGDTHLGGDDVDRMIVELIQAEVRARFGASLDFPPATRQALRNFAEATKIRLSEEASATIAIDLGDGREFARTITRDELEAMIEPWVKRTLDCCRRALRAADLEPGDVDRVVMVGGSTRVPLVQRRVAALFETEPYTALNPDEVVALGAAVQGSILRGDRRDTLLLDVIPLSLGIETLGGAVAKLITANSTIPARATERFSTYVDGQTNVKVHVLQGERELAADCRSLGVFELRGIPPMPAGLPKLEVTFLVDANGVLSVSAVERRSEKRASIQIVPNHGLTREEVERMEAESYEHAREDMAAHRLIDLRNQAKLDIRAIERQIAKVGDALDAEYRAEIESKVAAVRALMEQDAPDLDALHAALDTMDKSTVRLAELAIAQTLREDEAARSADGGSGSGAAGSRAAERDG